MSVDSDQWLLKENEYQSLLSKLSVELYDVTVKIDTLETSLSSNWRKYFYGAICYLLIKSDTFTPNMVADSDSNLSLIAYNEWVIISNQT